MKFTYFKRKERTQEEIIIKGFLLKWSFSKRLWAIKGFTDWGNETTRNIMQMKFKNMRNTKNTKDVLKLFKIQNSFLGMYRLRHSDKLD